MQKYHSSPNTLIISFWQNRSLIFSLVTREVVGRYRGSMIGLLWSFINPLLMLAIYTFVFSEVFKAKWPGNANSKIEFAFILFIGLILFNLFSECINRSPSIILNNANFVKKVIFPLEILPIISLGSACFHFCISLGVWLIAYLIVFGLPSPLFFIFPLVLLPLLLFTLGFSYTLASLGIYIRDISQIVGILTTVLMFLSPIFYPVSSLPEVYRVFINLNPLTQIIEQARNVLYFNHIPSIYTIFALMLSSSIICFLGFHFFQKTRKGFADVI